MKPKHKKIFYKISYLLFICIISFIDSISNKEYLYLVSNPLIFVILDFIVIRKIMKEVETLKEELTKTKSEFICTEHLIPILEGKQKRNKNKIKYLELQIKKIKQLIEERTRTKKLVIKPGA